jgi:hypothetical protein
MGVMKSEVKDTMEILAANGTAIGISLTECNEILTFISLVLAISISLYKLYYWTFKK